MSPIQRSPKFIPGEPDDRYPHDEPLVSLGETERAFEAWICFRDQGLNRRMTKVADICKSHTSTVSNWSKQFHWAERLANWNQEQELLAFRQNQEDSLLLGSELLSLGRRLTYQLNSKIASLVHVEDIERAARAYERLARTARLLMGQSTENVAQKIELTNFSHEDLQLIEEIHLKSQKNGKSTS